MTHSILGIWIMIDKSSAGKRSMYIHISGWHSFCFGALSSLTVTRWGRWRSGPQWHRSWWWCTLTFAPPVCLSILRCGIVHKMTAVRLIITNHCQVSCHRSLHLVMPRKNNTPLHLLSDFSLRFHDSWLGFLYCSVRKPFCSHFDYIQGKTHVRRFKLYPTSLSCKSS